VNDAPALKKADIGVAMGLRGTQVAREAADMVLKDDELGTIVTAVAQGRAIVANIRKFVVYLMSCNVSEILVVGLGVLLQGPLPILPLQILFLNLVTDVFPALALGVCEGSPALMRQSPRDSSEPILSRHHWRSMFALGGIIALSVLAALLLCVHWLEKPAGEATTVAFLTLAMAQLWHVFSMRNRRSGWISNEITRNPWIWGALVLCVRDGPWLSASVWSHWSRVSLHWRSASNAQASRALTAFRQYSSTPGASQRLRISSRRVTVMVASTAGVCVLRTPPCRSRRARSAPRGFRGHGSPSTRRPRHRSSRCSSSEWPKRSE
jgi:hypothetical protein